MQMTNEVKIIINSDECVGKWCGLCVDICPHNAIWINNVAHINQSKCTKCGECTKNICPNYAISFDNAGGLI